MIQETKSFKKRFHMTATPEKMRITKLLGHCVAKKQMPGGRQMNEQEFNLLTELLEWCNQNIFFDITPRYDTPKF